MFTCWSDGELDLSLEPLGRHSSCEFRREDLHDELAPEPDFVEEEDARHSAATELALQSVGRA